MIKSKRSKIFTGDTVRVTSGGDRGLVGTVVGCKQIGVTSKLLVEGVNLRKKGFGKNSGKLGFHAVPGPIDISNVKLIQKGPSRFVKINEAPQDISREEIED